MDEDDIPDTRVFVSGLPPQYTSEQLGAHFAGRYQITDSVVIPNRRIGFVGFRNYTLAKNAVKYFDKSYIRMSKISVEIAKPVDFHREINASPDPEPHDAPKAYAEQKALGVTTSTSSKSAFTPYEPMTTKTSNKRKRAEQEDHSGEANEYVSDMQPKPKQPSANGESIPKADTLKANGDDESVDRTAFAIEQKNKRKSRKDNEPEADVAETSETEKKRRKKEKKEKKRLLEAGGQPLDEAAADREARKKRKAERKLKAKSKAEGGVEPLDNDASGFEVAETDTAQPIDLRSDNDWLRGKTSRLLDLVDQDEPTTTQNEAQLGTTPEVFDSDHDDAEPKTESDPQGDDSDAVAARTLNLRRVPVPNGRLFVRNLPFSTNESDLESRFARYGNIIEVSA